VYPTNTNNDDGRLPLQRNDERRRFKLRRPEQQTRKHKLRNLLPPSNLKLDEVRVKVITMNNLLIRMVELGPLRVAYTHTFSKTPEQDAWNKLKAWGVPKGLLDSPAEQFNFGYNNPPPQDPSAPSGAYGYEVLITVGSEVEPEGEVKIKQISGDCTPWRDAKVQTTSTQLGRTCFMNGSEPIADTNSMKRTSQVSRNTSTRPKRNQRDGFLTSTFPSDR
jgi:hypothetical protein